VLHLVRYTEKVVVVGAGISGLSCGYRLQELGTLPLVLEAKDRPGGSIATVRKNGYLFELGPQSPRFPAAVWRLVRELNLEDEFLAGDRSAKRYIVKDGRLQEAPLSAQRLLSTRLVGMRSKFRLLTEVLRHSHPPQSEETLAEFVQRKFGDEVLQNLVVPFVSAVFFGDPYRMGMQSAFPMLVNWERDYGSVVRGALRARKRKVLTDSDGSSANNDSHKSDATVRVTDALPTLGSFRQGMGALPERLAERLDSRIRYRVCVTGITGAENADDLTKAWQIKLSNDDTIDAQHLVLAVPAFVAAKLLNGTNPRLASLLSQVEYAPLRVASFVYERSQVAHSLDGFGFSVPRVAGLCTICTFWNSSLFSGRAPERQVVITSFARKLARDRAGTAEENWVTTVEAESARILGISGKPVEVHCWEDLHALPQYNVGHALRVQEISSMLRSLPNLHLIGNFFRGRSIGDCVELGFAAAEGLHSRPAGAYI
jgi:protoporphyrinogen/coproporphyrinogen III oxidase